LDVGAAHVAPPFAPVGQQTEDERSTQQDRQKLEERQGAGDHRDEGSATQKAEKEGRTGLRQLLDKNKNMIFLLHIKPHVPIRKHYLLIKSLTTK
jgi:hypothetical protein